VVVLMDTVTVSSKFQVVIPAHVRREHRIRSVDKLAVIVKHSVIHRVPIRPFAQSKNMFGSAPVTWGDVRDRRARI
jgi:AbrB family looped-hinge helix DNA binding protein